jgi:prepilin-type N-terminal cleavage/methylation domain-containing protein
MGRRGFTLLELILVLSFISLILGLASAHFGRILSGSRYDATVKEVSANFMYARALARLRGMPQTVVFDFDERVYGVSGRSQKNLKEGISIKAIEPLKGETTEGKYRVTFFPDGTAEEGTVVVFTEKKATEIRVDPVVGAVVVKDE